MNSNPAMRTTCAPEPFTAASKILVSVSTIATGLASARRVRSKTQGARSASLAPNVVMDHVSIIPRLASLLRNQRAIFASQM